jgi:AAA family ATP:ADP antiporter
VQSESNFLTRAFSSATTIRSNEIRATLYSFGFVFTLMAAYFILRPVRDALSSNWSDAELSVLWSSTFFFSLVAVSLYGAVIARVRFRRLVPGVYVFFSLSFFAFYFGTGFIADADWVDKAFYVWLSVFSLFHVSVFWSFMSDLYSHNQAKRLFGFIAMGSSVGAIVGPAVPLIFAGVAGTDNLMLIAAAMLLLPVPLISRLEHLRESDLHRNDGATAAAAPPDAALGKNPLAGFSLFLKNPLLLGIGLFILLYVAIGSFVYFELKNLLADFDNETRTRIWAGIDLAVNALAIITATFATSRIATRWGMAATLALIPAFMVLGMAAIAIAPLVWVVVALQVARRAGNYAITRPGREMLFTIVDRETRFKAKPVIDIVIYRGGDMVTAWAFTLLTQGVGLGLAAVAAVGAGIAFLWAIVGARLGTLYESKTGQGEES